MNLKERIQLDSEIVIGSRENSLTEGLSGLKSSFSDLKLRRISHLINDHWVSTKKSPDNFLLSYMMGSDISEEGNLDSSDSEVCPPTIFSDLSLGEGQYNFCLLYDCFREENNFVPLGGLSFSAREGYLEVVQLQGLKGKKSDRKSLNALTKLYWKELLLDYFVEWAYEYDVPRIKILGVRNNPWALMTKNNLDYYLRQEIDFERLITMDKDGFQYLTNLAIQNGMSATDIHLWPSRGYKIYDETALDMGFESDGWGNYEKHLISTQF